jgi:hypothetical protein
MSESGEPDAAPVSRPGDLPEEELPVVVGGEWGDSGGE